MVLATAGVPIAVTSLRIPHYVALAGALTLALGLAGCGVKGALEPPPSAAITPNQQTAQTAGSAQSAAGSPQPQGSSSIGAPTAQPSAASLMGQPTVAASVARGTTSSAVTHAPAAKQSIPLDWLIK
jgi:predicted small lipoprotein YifL